MSDLILPDLISLLNRAALAAEAYADDARQQVAEVVAPDGRVDRRALDAEQHVVHGLAWAAAYAQTLRQTAAWAADLDQSGRLTENEALPAQLLAFEYLSQLAGGVPMNQGEVFRPGDLGLDGSRFQALIDALRPGARQG